MANIAVARAYQASFQSRPNTTLAVTGGTFNALGDFVAQTCQNTYGKQEHTGPTRYDIDRTIRFFCFGFAISPLIGRWNVFLERHFPLRASSGLGNVSLKALFKRVAADQIVMAPIGLSLFLGSMGMMERRSMAQIKQKFSDLYTPALLTNWQVWPIAQFINFRFMPLPYRVPFQSTCGIFWTLYLSIINSKEDTKQDREAELHKTITQ
ncbi:hypothetical protein J3R30DRAFT_326152 [Lentinula aciculospora]|uniref:Uncharacterized protein n=1 Tax=Lentinula aciculospora TaxID=153920 RepID=A0A9W9A932_9AGAR|nr:hypothetical protein J3R30DRAFT_326152 [Lentinula aciculospora]